MEEQFILIGAEFSLEQQARLIAKAHKHHLPVIMTDSDTIDKVHTGEIIIVVTDGEVETSPALSGSTVLKTHPVPPVLDCAPGFKSSTRNRKQEYYRARNHHKGRFK